MVRYLLISLGVMALIATGMTIAQIWAFAISWDFYIKAMLTLGVLALLVGLLIMIISDMNSKKQMRDENYLD